MCRTGFAVVIGLTLSVVALSETKGGGERSREPTGASLALTSDEPTLVHARALLDVGRFAEARRALERGGQSRAGREALEIMQRVRIAYALDAATLLDRVREGVPDVTAQDLERWRQAGQVQFRLIDGKVMYFGREPANLWRFCDEAKRRRKLDSRPRGWTLESHLSRVIAEAQKSGGGIVTPVRQRVKYTLTVSANAPHVRPGALVRVWLPLAQEYRTQSDVRLLRTSPADAVVAPPATGQWPLHGAAQRTIYLERRAPSPSGPMTFEAEFECTSSAYYPMLNDTKALPLPADYDQGHLGERPPHILFSKQLRETVWRVVGEETNPLTRARRIFHFVATHIAYCAEEEYSTIPSLSAKALTSGRGDCGVQTMLFIAMCRCAGIPARWQSGWQTMREHFDMHDWCEFYVAPWGWLPADPSYGLRDSADPLVREFYFGHQDAYRLIVNRDYGYPLVPPKESLRSEPLDFQRGEVEVDGHNLYFPYWDYDMQVQWLDEGP